MSTNIPGLPVQFNGTTLPAVFERVVQMYPENIAVSDGKSHLTYRELNKRAESLAETLRKAGVTRDGLVGLCLEKSCDLVVGILGILKAGGAYVPLDPTYPTGRREYIARSCALKLVVASNETAECVNGLSVVDVGASEGSSENDDETKLERHDKESLAYVIFTSGSSGQPKGVMIDHQNVVRLFSATHDLFEFGPADVWCLFHSIAFDFSVWELWGALLFGGRVVIVSNEISRDPNAFHALLVREKVTVLNQTPSSFRNLIVADAARSVDELSLRYVVFGGERLNPRMLAPWVERHGVNGPRLVNMYGITETTVHVTWKLLDEADIASCNDKSPIGMPISDLKIEIADISGQTVPQGKEGLIYVSGAGVSRGYLGQLDLTRERFVYRTDAAGNCERWYNSGDLGVQVGPNTYAYIGRADRQLKVRGYRIEPGEIEACLKQHPDVQDAIVISADFGEGDFRLVAYVLSGTIDRASETLVNDLRSIATKTLPIYMVPSAYITVDHIPTTLNGKLDEDALLRLLRDKLTHTGEPAVVQCGSVEGELRSIWTSVLGIETTDRNAEFFDLGGTSFTLIHLLQRVNSTFRTDLQVDVFSKGATLSTLINAVTANV